MSNQRLIQAMAAALAVALVGGASVLLRPINQTRETMGLSATREEVDSMPPDIALSTMALGGFRGLAVDYFWIRAEMLKEQGRFYEANQLANWICKLQPRFAKVWAFQAWNLGWNISVATRTFEERWNWVYNGAVKLLRDEALRYNPKTLSLYRELAWVFFFKMGDYLDDYHWAYKRQWAWEMHRLLGPPPADLQASSTKVTLQTLLEESGAIPTAPRPVWEPKVEPSADETQVAFDDETVQRVIEWFRQLVEAPATWDELVADPEMAKLVAQAEQAGIQLRVQAGATALVEVMTGTQEVNQQFFDRYQRVLAPTFRQELELTAGTASLTDDEKALQGLLEDERTRPLTERLVAFLRSQVLRGTYKMDPAWMLALMEQYGPIDWRLPESHGIYWTSYGVKMMQDLGVEDVGEFFGPNTPLNTDRLMIFALQRFTYFGRLFFEPDVSAVDRSYLDVLPDLRFVQATHQAYLNIARKYDPETGQIAGEEFRDGHQNFLRDAVRLFYLYGQFDLAEHYYRYLRTQYRLRVTGEVNPDYLLPLNDFVTHEEFRERLTDIRTFQGAITSYLRQSLRLLAAGEGEEAVAMTRYAKQELYDWYMKQHEDKPTERMKVPPFQQIYNDVVAGELLQPGGEDMLLGKVRLWRALPVRVQLDVYDRVIETLRQQCALANPSYAQAVDKLFPPPPDLEEHRQKRAERRAPEGPGYQEGAESIQELRERARQGWEQSLQQRGGQ